MSVFSLLLLPRGCRARWLLTTTPRGGPHSKLDYTGDQVAAREPPQGGASQTARLRAVPVQLTPPLPSSAAQHCPQPSAAKATEHICPPLLNASDPPPTFAHHRHHVKVYTPPVLSTHETRGGPTAVPTSLLLRKHSRAHLVSGPNLPLGRIISSLSVFVPWL
eukprot:scaffold45140_cov20-Tisochrysis_lutea.AAC.4